MTREPLCALWPYAPDVPCSGRMVHAHIIKRQVIERELRSTARREGWTPRLLLRVTHQYITDPRGWVWACGGIMGNGGHHGMLDSRSGHDKVLRLPRSALPADAEEFAAELGLGWWLEREYGPPAMQP